MKAFRYKEIKIWWHDAGHMTKMAAMRIYGKKWKQLIFQNYCNLWPESW